MNAKKRKALAAIGIMASLYLLFVALTGHVFLDSAKIVGPSPEKLQDARLAAIEAKDNAALVKQLGELGRVYVIGAFILSGCAIAGSVIALTIARSTPP